MGASKVMIYYYTGECTPTGYSICNSWITLPTECVWSGESARDLTTKVNSDIYELSQNYVLNNTDTACIDINELGLQRISTWEQRTIQTDPRVDIISRYYWFTEIGAPCIKGEIPDADVNTQQITGSGFNIRSSISNDLGIAGRISRYKYTLNIYGCSDFDDVYYLYLNDGEIIACDSADPYFCTC
jgi:hypothetical protein